MASSQGTQPQNPFLVISLANEHHMIIPYQIPLLTPYFTLSFLLFG
jgi:hypothetical protein